MLSARAHIPRLTEDHTFMPSRKTTATATGTPTRRARSGTTRRAASAGSAQQIIWQGASLNGQHLFQLVKSGINWYLYELNFTGANAASRKMVTTGELFMEAFAALGSQYALMIAAVPATRLANRSIRATAANAIPGAVAETTVAGGGNTATARRVRRRTSVSRSGSAPVAV
jgi:hypothetical protein